MKSGIEELSVLAVRDLRRLTQRAAELWPERVALTFDKTGECITFDELERRSNAFGNALHALGVTEGDRVAVMLRNRAEFPLAWLGIAKIGAIMVPINVFYKSTDAGYLLEHSEAKLIVTAKEFVPLISAIEGRDLKLKNIVSVDDDGDKRAVDLRELVMEAPETAPPVTVLPETLANLQYTSGTTGMPKGCMLSHFFWILFGRTIVTEFGGLSEEDVVLTAQPFYYADPQWVLVMTMLIGAELVVLDRFHPSSFWSKVREHGVTFFYCLGVMPKLLFKTSPGASDRDHSVRFVFCSALSQASHHKIEERWGVPWYELYGMTECGMATLEKPEEHEEVIGTGCIGRATRERELRVVDDEGRRQPRGRVGELILRGPGLMDGYFKNAEATKAMFIDGWLHTGDFAWMDEQGRLYFVGRKKHMIRRSGENISATEVEEVIEKHEQVKITACAPVPDDLRGEEVKAYVVLQDGVDPKSVPPRDLIEFCEQRLAYFKVPRYWTYRDDLPRTPSERIRKEILEDEGEDPRLAAYDKVDDVWR